MSGKTLLLSTAILCAQTTGVFAQDFLSSLSATKNDPLYTTYAAALTRSEFIVDEGYEFVWYDGIRGIDFVTDKAGNLCLGFKLGGEFRYLLSQMEREPVITTSYSDLVKYYYYPFREIRVEVFFQVYSSRIAIEDVRVVNEGQATAELSVYPFLHHGTDVLSDGGVIAERDGLTFRHKERPDGWTRDHGVPNVEDLVNAYLLDTVADSWGVYAALGSMSPGDPTTEFFSDVFNPSLSNEITQGSAKVAALQKGFVIPPGQSAHFRLTRGVAEADGDVGGLIAACRAVRTIDLEQFVRDDEETYRRIPRLDFDDPREEMMYWSSFSLVRQCTLPPEGDCSYNYYVFSREPTWGWGHGGQVFHESLVMLAYVFMDPKSAMDSQRVYRERQRSNGYINYRTGPYLNETIPYNNQLTTSAPWLSWENWEIYGVTKDTSFLREAYESGSKFYQFWLENRDVDGDGLSEWGAHALLECVRDGKVAVWDQVGWPSNFEALDLNSMLVREAKSLSSMAGALGDAGAGTQWLQEAEARAGHINQYMWDSTTGFYYHVDKSDHDFTFRSPNDLKREEIIGFLPLWAGVASQEQAERLVEKLLTPSKFWRQYGVPTLAADDPYYDPMGYWNGPVWVQWQYLIFRGLLEYGFRDFAEQLARKVFDTVIDQLSTNHSFWELYSPDSRWAGWNKPYIWSALVSRMEIDLRDTTLTKVGCYPCEMPGEYGLFQNFPNPFNSQTRITYHLPTEGFISLAVHDVLGRSVRTFFEESKQAGEYSVQWNGKDDEDRDVASGVYLCRMESGGHTQTLKMVLMR